MCNHGLWDAELHVHPAPRLCICASCSRLQLEGASDGDTCLEVGRLRKQDNGKWVFASVLAGAV